MAYDQELAARIRAALSFETGVSEKQMFGGLAFLLAGHLLAAASGRGGLMLRVDPELGGSLVDGAAVQPFEMNGRRMSGWLHIDDAALGSEDELREWLGHAITFVRGLPPK